MKAVSLNQVLLYTYIHTYWKKLNKIFNSNKYNTHLNKYYYNTNKTCININNIKDNI